MQTERNIWLRVLSMILTLALLISCVPNQVYAMAGEALDNLLEATDTAVLQPNATPDPVLSTAHIVAEDASRRGETYKEYVMNNGLRLATVYPSAIHYEENGVWKDIDNTLVAAVSSGKAVYQNAAGAWNVRFPQTLSGGDMVGVTKDGHMVQFGMAGEMRSSGGVAVASVGTIGQTEAVNALAVSSAQTATAQIHQIDMTAARAAAEHPETVLEKLNSRLSYANVYPNTNVVYDLQGNRLKESVVLQRYDADLWGYRYTLDTGDLVPVLREDQQIDLCHPETNEVVLTMPAPYMMDDNGETSYDVEVVLTRNGSKYLLSYYLPRAWLAENDRTWPVILDPVIQFAGNYSNVDDITVGENRNEAVGRAVIQCGYYEPLGAMRMYMQFLQLPPMTSADVIVDATIRMNKPYGSNASANIFVQNVTESWEQDTISWANQPTVNDAIADYVICQAAGHYTWNITSIVRDWYEIGNYGMMFRTPDAVEDAGVDNWKQFYSSEFNLLANDIPFLSITYQYDITLDQTSASVYKGDTMTLTATTIPASHAVTWESDAPTIASVSDTGVVTGLSTGNATITAKLTDEISASCTIEVLAKTISLNYNTSDSPATVHEGGAITLTATTEPFNEEVDWASLNPEIATVNNGVVTGVSVGIATIQASLDDGTCTECSVYVQPKEISLNRTAVSLYTGGTTTLTATTLPPGENVVWESLDTSVARVSNTGVVTAVNAGETTIRAYISEDIYAICTVTVVNRTISLNTYSIEIAVGESFQLTATTVPHTWLQSWSSLNTSIATVNDYGEVVGVATGQTSIMVTIPYGPMVFCQVKVVPRHISISGESSVREGESLTLSVTKRPTDWNVIWSSSDPSIATVSQTGEVIGVKAGTVTITATMEGGPNATHTVYVAIADGVYYIQNLQSGFYLHVSNGGITSLTDVYQYSKYSSTTSDIYKIRQMWKIHYLGEGLYSIRPMHKLDMGLDVTGYNVDIYRIGTDDTLIGVPSYTEWAISWYSTGYIFKNNGSDSKTMQIENASASLGGAVVASAYSTSVNCRWGLTRISSPPSGAYWFDTNTERVVSGNLTDTKYIIYGSTYDIDDLGLIAIAYSPTSNYQTFTWSSSNTAIATINSSTGAIVGKNSGEIKITAKRYINGSYHTLSFNLIVIGADQYGAGVRIANVNGKQYYDFTIPVNALFEDAVALCEDHRCMNWTQYCTWAYDISIFYQPSLSEHKGMQLGSFLWFYQQVNHGAAWDIKRETQWKAALPGLPYLRDEDGKFGDFVFRGAVTTAEGLGNIMYGYTGRAAGFGEITLYWGGGVAAQGSVNSDTVTQPPYYGDTKEDHNNIKLGFDMFNEDYPNYPDVGYDGIPLDGWLAAIADVILNPGT